MLKRYFVLLFLILLSASAALSASKKFTLVIDAGHGGHDTGATGALTKEKTINLNVALAFGRLVERNCPDVNVLYTRKSDLFVPLHTRADIANSAKADLFISIHTNSMPKSARARSIHGIETYTLGMHRAADNLDVAKRENSVILIEKDYKQRYQGFDPNSAESYIMFEFIQDRNMAQSVELAKAVQKHLCSRTGRDDKGVKQAGFLVLRETSMPSCLIELGFISNPDEERFLHSNSGVEQLGRGIYEAFVAYRKSHQTAAPAAPAETKRRKSRLAQELADVREGRAMETESDDKPATIDADSIVNSEPEPEEKSPLPAQQEKTSAAVPQPAQQPAPAEASAQPDAAPVFKVQILASDVLLKAGSKQLKGQKDVDHYRDSGMYKYTVGASTNYNEIYQLRKKLLTLFPQAFIIAFKDGKRTDVQQAIREFKNRRQ